MTPAFGNYLSLAKPRMVLGNIVVAMAAFIFASPQIIPWGQFFCMSAGLALIIGSGCAFNNYLDRHIDARMERTKGRALPSGAVSGQGAIVFASVFFAGGAVLLWYTNLFALGAAVAGFVTYVLFYTPLKHVSGYALFVGAVAGAMPPVVGYAAAAGTIDSTAAILFILLYLWQLPHFIAIAIYRFDEYATAGVPLLVGRYGERVRGHARATFYASLWVLLLFCAALLIFHFSASR
jgi:protoheme IX farnesyltransferase